MDREELADAYDEGESVVGIVPIRNSESDDRVSIDDVPPPDNLSLSSNDDPTKEEEQEIETEKNVDKSVNLDQPLDSEQETETEANESGNPELSLIDKNADTISMIPAIIDQATKEILIQQCKFTRAEVSMMKPDIAAVVAQKRLRRPLEGMPPNWIMEGVSAQTNNWNKETLIQMAKRIPKAVFPVSLAVLAIYGGLDVRNMFMVPESQKQVISEPEPQVREEIEQDIAATEGDHLAEVIVESLKPGATPKAPKDESWMDKVITCIANRFNTFWKLEI